MRLDRRGPGSPGYAVPYALITNRGVLLQLRHSLLQFHGVKWRPDLGVIIEIDVYVTRRRARAARSAGSFAVGHLAATRPLIHPAGPHLNRVALVAAHVKL